MKTDCFTPLSPLVSRRNLPERTIGEQVLGQDIAAAACPSDRHCTMEGQRRSSSSGYGQQSAPITYATQATPTASSSHDFFAPRQPDSSSSIPGLTTQAHQFAKQQPSFNSSQGAFSISAGTSGAPIAADATMAHDGQRSTPLDSISTNMTTPETQWGEYGLIRWCTCWPVMVGVGYDEAWQSQMVVSRQCQARRAGVLAGRKV